MIAEIKEKGQIKIPSMPVVEYSKKYVNDLKNELHKTIEKYEVNETKSFDNIHELLANLGGE